MNEWTEIVKTQYQVVLLSIVVTRFELHYKYLLTVVPYYLILPDAYC